MYANVIVREMALRSLTSRVQFLLHFLNLFAKSNCVLLRQRYSDTFCCHGGRSYKLPMLLTALHHQNRSCFTRGCFDGCTGMIMEEEVGCDRTVLVEDCSCRSVSFVPYR